jgi:hypothetical protein
MFEFQSCIGPINGIFIQICKPWNNLTFHSWFNEQKNMYYMNNMVINHCELFIYLDLGYLWRWLMKKIDSKKGKYIFFFHATTIQINYLHK